MEIDDLALRDVLHSVCSRARQTVRQSNDVVIQQSHQRLSGDAFDLPALHVIAASSLVHHQPARTLDLLQQNDEVLQGDAVGNRLAGYAWLVQQDAAMARHFFDKAVRLDPNQPDCWNWLGRIAERDDEYERAAEYYERGILFDDGDHDSALALSNLHTRNRHLNDAIHTLRICLIRDRRSPKLNFALARLLDRRAIILGRRRKFIAQQRIQRESLECYRIVNATAPTSLSLVKQGRLEQLFSEFASARATFQAAVDLDPGSAGALCHLAGANVDFGQIEAAIGQFEQSIALDPRRAETHFRYARAKKFKAGVETRRYLTQLAGQLETVGEKPHKQIYLNFAIAKVCDDAGDFDRAWQHYERANRIKVARPGSKGKRHSEASGEQAALATSKQATSNAQGAQAFSSEFFRTTHRFGHPSKTPIFIVGMPRSGTTLTEQILSSHPDVAGAGELNSINQIRHEILRDHYRGNRQNECPATAYPDVLMALTQPELRRYADQYLDKLENFRTSESRVTDKMPTNFLHLGLIATLFPGATVIHCRRNPMDVFVSCYCQNLNAPFCDLDQLVAYHRDYRRTMRHWENVLPIKIHTNDYESLVADPERHTRALIEHCGLPWNDACLKFHANDRAVHTPSKWQVRQPMYRSSVEKWRRFEKHLAPIAAQVAAEMAEESQVETRLSA